MRRRFIRDVIAGEIRGWRGLEFYSFLLTRDFLFRRPATTFGVLTHILGLSACVCSSLAGWVSTVMKVGGEGLR